MMVKFGKGDSYTCWLKSSNPSWWGDGRMSSPKLALLAGFFAFDFNITLPLRVPHCVTIADHARQAATFTLPSRQNMAIDH